MALNSFNLVAARGKVKSITTLLSLLVLFTMVMTACGGGTTSNAASKKAVLKVATQSYDFAQAGFNPYNGHPNAGLQGLVYKALHFVNVNGGAFTPMLATSYKWNSDNTSVTFTIRQNVK
jgi:peptide/nickel transport system substrate-binding protein